MNYQGEKIISSDIDERIRQLLAQYDTPQACAAELLCDRHPDDTVAFTVVESDLSTTDLTYGDLRRSRPSSLPHWPNWASSRAIASQR